MNSSRLAISLVALALLASPAVADGFSLWNPFAKKPAAKKAVTHGAAKKKDSSWLKLPGLGGKTKKPATRGKEPSVLAKMNHSTKQFFSNAKNSLTPGSKKTASSRPSGYGASGGVKTARKSAKKDEGNILTSWWKSDEPEPTRPRTVPDWMAGERP